MKITKQPVIFVAKPKSERSEKLSISLPGDLVEWIDSKVLEYGSDRSKVIRSAVELAKASEAELIQVA